CYENKIGILSSMNYLHCLTLCLAPANSSGIHVQNVQICYIEKFVVPCWCAALINSSFPINISFTNV
uniref:Uncharacterized protein n=1 Tax=Macaca fascicularis TaxID=9541 RepID=A0A7N9CBZ6_MACFA